MWTILIYFLLCVVLSLSAVVMGFYCVFGFDSSDWAVMVGGSPKLIHFLWLPWLFWDLVYSISLFFFSYNFSIFHCWFLLCSILGLFFYPIAYLFGYVFIDFFFLGNGWLFMFVLERRRWFHGIDQIALIYLHKFN